MARNTSIKRIIDILLNKNVDGKEKKVSKKISVDEADDKKY